MESPDEFPKGKNESSETLIQSFVHIKIKVVKKSKLCLKGTSTRVILYTRYIMQATFLYNWKNHNIRDLKSHCNRKYTKGRLKNFKKP